MIAFYNREKEVGEVCLAAEQNALLNIYGEAGIGKTRLLQESIAKLKHKTPSPITILVDLQPLAEDKSRVESLLSSIAKQSEGRLSGIRRGPEETAGHIIGQLSKLAADQPVYLMFDNTESLQEETDFWQWMHKNLVEPLVFEPGVKQIFAGRIPVPWRRFELRRTVKLLPLEPLGLDTAIRSLIKESLEQAAPPLRGAEDLDQAIDLVFSFAFGHPGLSEEIAAFVGAHWPVEQPMALQTEICKEVIEPFINETLFTNVVPPWKDILWLASILEWFDPTILQRYLQHVAPELVDGHPDYFFIQGIARLRTENTVVWREERGDRLHGVLKNIVRQCLKTMQPECYRNANLAAAHTFESIASAFTDEPETAEQYREQANFYRRAVGA